MRLRIATFRPNDVRPELALIAPRWKSSPIGASREGIRAVGLRKDSFERRSGVTGRYGKTQFAARKRGQSSLPHGAVNGNSNFLDSDVSTLARPVITFIEVPISPS